MYRRRGYMIDIREEKDINIIQPLWDALNRQYQIHSRHFSDTFRNKSFKDYVKRYRDQNYRLEVIYQDQKPLGYIIGHIQEDLGYIDALYIYDDLRGMGLGGYLFNRMMTWLKVNEVKNISLEIEAGNEDMILFYQKMGFYTSQYKMRYEERL